VWLLESSPRQKPSRGRRGGGGVSHNDFPGVEISIARDVGEMVRVNHCDPYREDLKGILHNEVPALDIVDNKPRYVGSEIVHSRSYGNLKKMFPHRFEQYRVAWEGYSPEED